MDDSQTFGAAGGEPVELSPFRTEWVMTAASWAERIKDCVAPTEVQVEHIGSTSVPGLLAKPVVDLQVTVPDLADEESYRPGLESLGLTLRQREPHHRFFRPPSGRPRTVHVHVYDVGSSWALGHLRFRDRLRSDPALVAAYAELKHHLAETVGHDRGAYNRGKENFILDVIGGSH